MITPDYVTFSVVRYDIRLLVVLAVVEHLHTPTDDHVDLIAFRIDELFLLDNVRSQVVQGFTLEKVERI